MVFRFIVSLLHIVLVVCCLLFDSGGLMVCLIACIVWYYLLYLLCAFIVFSGCFVLLRLSLVFVLCGF